METDRQKTLNAKDLEPVLAASGFVTSQATAAILITHKTTLPLLVPLPFEVKIQSFVRPNLCLSRFHTGRLVRLKLFVRLDDLSAFLCENGHRRIVAWIEINIVLGDGEGEVKTMSIFHQFREVCQHFYQRLHVDALSFCEH